MHDLVLGGGTVYDGRGARGVSADVAVVDGRIRAVGRGLGAARRVIDVGGLAVAPGFVDAHTHSDLMPLTGPAQPFKLLQGVTTEVVGNCGISFAPVDTEAAETLQSIYGDLACGTELRARSFGEYLDEVQAAGPMTNIAALVGHGTLRVVANGMRERLREGALGRMRALLGEALAAGAFGLSSGLIYPPGSYADTAELVALAEVLRPWGRVYATHLRDEGDRLLPALDEAIEVAEGAGVRLQVSHCKVTGRRNHGSAPALLDRLRAARERGVDVRGDAYPYTSGATVLVALLPPAAAAGGSNALAGRLADAGEREALRASASAGRGLWSAVTPADVLVSRHADGAVVGRTLADLSRGQDPWLVLCRIIASDPAATAVLTAMDLGDVCTILADPLIGIGSDSIPSAGPGHPRSYGCFPEFLGRYVRELGVVDLPVAVRKLTFDNAARFGLADRGRLEAGVVADVCVFDPEVIAHPGGYADPRRAPVGVEHVLLAGQPVVVGGEFSGDRVGQVLRAR
ncbi:N-acyl-D-amino-acid deacylase family protein [Embleya hyalina]|uniref:N-acyl-D-amino-acid deacylase n=1 Tax=Embleya hyalina TaxID=516124 RepID=A0A401YXA2_9ACTN|nr:D-aminoacylase [Embleya hyalina]GCD99155.1 N-acyl-D-amino-acid deacylase [Embleya hyalina]